MIENACDRVEIAGSIRRGPALVGDIEIVCQPRMVPDPGALIGGELVSALDGRVAQIVNRGGAVSFDEQHKANGPRYKRLQIVDQKAGIVKVDLFAVLPPASWGAILTIRTGPADFSRGLVTRRSYGGAMPDDMELRDGVLVGPGGPIDTPDEVDFFTALGLPYCPPEERSWNVLKKILARIRTGVK